MRDPSGPLAPVLLVDDDPTALSVLSDALAERFPVAIARNAESAEVAVRRTRPAAVLARLELTGSDGVEVLGLARRVQPGAVRVLTVSAATVRDVARALDEADVHRVVPLPADPRRLASWLGEAVQRAREQANDAAGRAQLPALLLESLARALLAARPEVRARAQRVAALVDPVASEVGLSAADRRLAHVLALLHPLGPAVRGPRPALPPGLPPAQDLGRALEDLQEPARDGCHPAASLVATLVAFDQAQATASVGEAVGMLVRESGDRLPPRDVEALLRVLREGRSTGEFRAVARAA